MKYTAGPWEYRSRKYDDWGVVRAGNYFICQAHDPAKMDEEILDQHRASRTDPWEANGRLIAAAPDLLEALREAVLQIEYMHGKFAGTGSGENVLTKCNAAIAKATTP